MKELSTEEKVRRYDEALDNAKVVYKTIRKDLKPVIEQIFPELKESEDEKIRKELIAVINDLVLPNEQKERFNVWFEKQSCKDSQLILPQFMFDDILALQCCMETVKKVQEDKELYEQLQSLHDRLHDAYWLEKQGEQKVAVFIPKFRVGDKLVSTKNPRLTYEVLEVGHINELGNPEYKVGIFTDGKVSNPHNIHYMECYKVDEWAKLIE